MTKKQRGLGKGLGALLASSTSSNVVTSAAVNVTQDYLQINISNIVPGKYQPRRNFKREELQELAESIKSQGILQPLVVRKDGSGYEIIAGERRWRAAQLAGLQKVPAIIKTLDNKTTAAIAIIENVQREDLNALEEAIAISRLIDEFGLTHLEVAKVIGKSRTAISNLLRILSLNADVKELLKDGKIELGHAKVLLALIGDQQSVIAKIVVAKNLSVRATEQLIKSSKNVQQSKPNATSQLDPDVLKLQRSLSDSLGAKVALQHNSSGKGRLVISYNSLDELDGVLEKIKK